MDRISEFELFTEGDNLYASMLAAIEGAERAVRMESYIFAADEVGRRFAAALAARARAGADVRLHLDRLAFLGGFNIRRLNSRALSGETRQRDTHVGVTGELVRAGAASFDAVWSAKTLPPAEAIPDDPSEVQTALLVPSHSRRCEWRLACLHTGMIDRSLRHVYVTSPYLILVARERRLAESLRLQYERDLEDSREVLLPRWRHRGAGERGLEVMGRAVRRLL